VSDRPAIAIVLAGQRHGAVNPLAERAGVSHKCLVPIGGKPLIAHVLATLTALPELEEIRISVEPSAVPELYPVVAPFEASGVPIRLYRARRDLPTASLPPHSTIRGHSSSQPPTTSC
jgi:molybdopterin-guanine dinucleotide biosynthesis protein A